MAAATAALPQPRRLQSLPQAWHQYRLLPQVLALLGNRERYQQHGRNRTMRQPPACSRSDTENLCFTIVQP